MNQPTLFRIPRSEPTALEKRRRQLEKAVDGCAGLLWPQWRQAFKDNLYALMATGSCEDYLRWEWEEHVFEHGDYTRIETEHIIGALGNLIKAHRALRAAELEEMGR